MPRPTSQEIDLCIAQVQGLGTSEQLEVDACIHRLQPLLHRLPDGASGEQLVRAALLAGRPDRAVAYLRACARSGNQSLWVAITAVVALVAGGVAFTLTGRPAPRPAIASTSPVPRRPVEAVKKDPPVPEEEVAPVAQVRHPLRASGAVVGADGEAPAKEGARCSLTVTPRSFDERQLNCQIKVVCGEAVIYGWQGVGATTCRVKDGSPVSARDPWSSSEDNDPRLDLDVAKHSLVVSDDRWAVRIKLDE